MMKKEKGFIFQNPLTLDFRDVIISVSHGNILLIEYMRTYFYSSLVFPARS